MAFLSRTPYKLLYTVWAGLFILTAVLGLFFPQVENIFGLFFLRLISIAFFLPPWMILAKSKQNGNRFHLRLLRWLSVASLAATLLLVCAGILSVPYSEMLGNLIHVVMTIVCTPLVCSNFYALSMFLWATVLIASFGKK